MPAATRSPRTIRQLDVRVDARATGWRSGGETAGPFRRAAQANTANRGDHHCGGGAVLLLQVICYTMTP